MFEQAASEMKGLTDVVVSELEVQLQANINAYLGTVPFLSLLFADP